MRFKNNQNGFTLLEIIIAVGIFASMSVMATQVLNGIVDGKNRTEQRSTLQHAVNVGLSKMYDDIHMAFLADPSFHGKDAFFATGFEGDKTTLSFSTLSHIHFMKNNRDSDQVVVGYTLGRDSDGDMALLRRETDHLVPDIETGGRSFVLIPKISELEFDYYDSNEKNWQSDWDTNSVTAAGRLPFMVRVRVVVYGNYLDEDRTERREHEFEMIVPVAMYSQKIGF